MSTRSCSFLASTQVRFNGEFFALLCRDLPANASSSRVLGILTFLLHSLRQWQSAIRKSDCATLLLYGKGAALTLRRTSRSMWR